MSDAAKALSRAIGNRWDGWYSVSIGTDPAGGSVIRVSYDRGHAPALSVNDRYQGYPVDLRAVTPPAI